jgi:hypothetical protein
MYRCAYLQTRMNNSDPLWQPIEVSRAVDDDRVQAGLASAAHWLSSGASAGSSVHGAAE